MRNEGRRHSLADEHEPPGPAENREDRSEYARQMELGRRIAAEDRSLLAMLAK
jgi:hypothetical protein